MADSRRRPLPGSERLPLPEAQPVGPADPNVTIEVTIVLRPRSPGPAQPAGAGGYPGGAHLSREQLAAARGADPADVEQVRAFAAEHGLTVARVELAQRQVVLSGTVAAFSAAFGVDLQRWQHPGGEFRGRVGPIHLPESLLPAVVAVLGLDDRPQARAHIRRLSNERSPAEYGAIRARAARVSYTPVELATTYDFPATDGSGQTIGIIELGGGYQQADLDTYFAGLGLATPAVTAVSVDGATNQPVGSPDSADGEVALDIEVAGAIAPKAAIAVYFAPNTDRGFLDAITTAVHDTTNQPSIISISWGGPEPSWTAQALTAYDQAFQDAGLAGVTVLSASGDGGSSDGVTDGLAHVDFPASSPNVSGCGGTTLIVSGSSPDETVWNSGGSGGATGGGVSQTFDLPSWQAAAGVPPSANADKHVGRGVPDVAGDADPATGYQVRVDGTDAVFGGTSAVAPLWAGLVARLNHQLGTPLGFLNPSLYGPANGSFRDVTNGSNGAYQAGPGWDACTGLGSPDGQRLLQSLQPAGAGSADPASEDA